MFSRLFSFLVGLVVFHSCVPYSPPTAVTPASTYSFRKVDSKTWEIPNPKVYQIPLVATHDVTTNRVKGTSTIKSSEGTIEVSKNLAVADAVSKVQNCEQLVNPLFSTTIENGIITTEVTGYPAKIKEVRPFQVADTSLFFAINKLETKVAPAESMVQTISTASLVQSVPAAPAPPINQNQNQPNTNKKSNGAIILLIFIPLAFLVFWGLKGALSSD